MSDTKSDTALDTVNNSADELLNVLPPAYEEGESGDVDQGAAGYDEGDQAQAKPPASAQELDEIADKLITGAAKAGSMTVPEDWRPEYVRVFEKDELGLLRAGLHMTGATSALYELAPALGGAAAAGGTPAKQLHPVVRVLLGVGCLALATLVTRGQVNGKAARAEGSTGATVRTGSAPAAGGWGKSNTGHKAVHGS